MLAFLFLVKPYIGIEQHLYKDKFKTQFKTP